jgi:hypothetical protein
MEKKLIIINRDVLNEIGISIDDLVSVIEESNSKSNMSRSLLCELRCQESSSTCSWTEQRVHMK